MGLCLYLWFDTWQFAATFYTFYRNLSQPVLFYFRFSKQFLTTYQANPCDTKTTGQICQHQVTLELNSTLPKSKFNFSHNTYLDVSLG